MSKTSYKRKNNDDYKEIRRKIQKLEAEISTKRKKHRKRIISSSESESTGSDNDMTTMFLRPSVTTPAATNADLMSPLSITATSSPPAVASVTEQQISDPETSTAITPATDLQEQELDQEILALLGDAPKIDTNFGKATHKELALRWQEILEKGLTKEGKDKLFQEYLIPENCDLLVAPALNPEVKVALAETLVKRDFSLMAKQKQQSIISIAAINQTIELLISKESHAKILKPISDACRLLCDSHFDSTKTRRGFVLSSINSNMKEVIAEARRDSKYLFGETFSEKLKIAKSINKSGSDLKQPKNDKSAIFNKNNFVKTPKNTNYRRRLNWKTLPRKIAPKPDAGKSRLSQGRAGAGTGSQQRGTTDHAPTWGYKRR